MKRIQAAWIGIATLSSLGAGLPAGAQMDAPFSHPAARARGLGGAFVALADDSTAAWSNPAGLSSVANSELSLHGGAEENELSAERKGLSFAGAAMPVDVLGRRLGIGLFYARPFDSEDGDTPFFAGLKNEVLGVGGGLRLTSRVSVGLSVGLSTVEFARLSQPGDAIGSSPSKEDKDDSAFVTLGALWQPSGAWTVGGSWQLRSRYDSVESQLTLPARWALGVAWRPAGNWLISAELDRIEGSHPYGYKRDDVYEPHLGGEYALPTGMGKWSARGGWWRFRSPELDEPVDHFTAGAGFDIGLLAADLALDLSEAGDDVLLSVVFRPGGFRL